ncbi:Hypothetical predicted protein, partial [Paramuricea clavata]
NTVGEAKQRKSEATDILSDATFSLHKGASNANELDGESDNNEDRKEQTAAKQQLGVKPTETKILGVKWEEENDTLSVQLGSNSESPTKRSLLSRLAKIYDPIGIASPLLLQGKQVYREVCDHKLPWDVELKGVIKKRWKNGKITCPANRVNVDSRQHGPLTTDEIDQQRLWWIKQVQAEAKKNSKCQNDSVQLNLQADADEILKCKGQVQGQLPIYLPDSSLFAVKLVEEAHIKTLHGELF